MKYGARHGEIDHSSRAAAAHQLSLSIQNDKAVQVVAAMASDLDDCLELLAMLGLEPHGTTTGSSLLAAPDEPRLQGALQNAEHWPNDLQRQTSQLESDAMVEKATAPGEPYPAAHAWSATVYADGMS